MRTVFIGCPIVRDHHYIPAFQFMFVMPETFPDQPFHPVSPHGPGNSSGRYGQAESRPVTAVSAYKHKKVFICVAPGGFEDFLEV